MSRVPPEIRGIPDPWVVGVKEQGWDVVDASQLDNDITLKADVLIIGTGAGGGTTAEILSAAGLKVVMLEEGKLKSSDEFDMQEQSAYRDLYQEGISRMTKDGAIGILQGRSVGGTTTVNWTSSFRTPDQTLQQWATEHHVVGKSAAEMAPFFEQMEERLSISKWQGIPNHNNDILARGCETLGFSWDIIPRNVNACWNLGYCGTGCPVNAKQSMLVTTVPGAMQNGATLVHHARAEKLVHDGNAVSGVAAVALDRDAMLPNGKKITVRAKHTVLAAGGINGPGLLLRSDVPDPHRRVGKRTFLHPTTATFAVFDEDIQPFYGAPQSVYSDHFQWQTIGGPLSYKLEVMPLHPALTAALMGGHGEWHQNAMRELPNLNGMIALLRDGFHEESQGGAIELRADGSPVLDYPINDFLMEGVKRTYKTMMEIQFAAGAKKVRAVHTDSDYVASWKDAQAMIEALPYVKYRARVASAHVMGGCMMGEDPKTAVCNSWGDYHHLDRLTVIDGSLFPTSIGANPQLSIYGLAAQLATRLRDRLKKGS